MAILLVEEHGVIWGSADEGQISDRRTAVEPSIMDLNAPDRAV
jgi:hypothetical protein